jgi:hypothetical protein
LERMKEVELEDHLRKMLDSGEYHTFRYAFGLKFREGGFGYRTNGPNTSLVIIDRDISNQFFHFKTWNR